MTTKWFKRPSIEEPRSIGIPTRALILALALGGWSCTESKPDPVDREAAAARAERTTLVEGSAAAAGAREAGTNDESVRAANAPAANTSEHSGKVTMSEAEWKKKLTPEQYYVCRQKGTERAFTGAYWNTKEDGTYRCVACGNELFSSDTKFDSGTGWPSYWAPIGEDKVKTEVDRSLFMSRTEVLCGRCESHLGHVFDDGPAPTNLRYCINSVALDFEPAEDTEKAGSEGGGEGKKS